MALSLLPLELVAGRDRRAPALWGLVALALLVPAIFAYEKIGGGGNAMIAVYVLGLLLLGRLPGWLDGLQLEGAARHALLAVGLSLLAIMHAIDGTGLRDQAEGIARHGWTDLQWTRLDRRAQSFEQRLAQDVAAAAGPVFVGARVYVDASGRGDLNTHQTPLYNATVRSRRHALGDLIGADLAAGRFKTIFLWHYEDPQLERLVAQHYQQDFDYGPDPLIGTKVTRWRRR